MKLHEHLLNQLKGIFQKVDAQMELIAYIDQAILTLDRQLHEILNNICNRIEKASDANRAIIIIPAGNKLLPMSDGEDSNQFTVFAMKKMDKILSLGPSEYLIMEYDLSDQQQFLCLLPIFVDRSIFAILLMSFSGELKDRGRIVETLHFLQMVISQIEIMIKRFLELRKFRLNSTLVKVFFDSKLKPSACFHKIVEQASSFLPDWFPLLIDPKPKVQLILYSEGDRHLRILATEGDEMVGTEVLVDSSVCGLLIEDRSLTHIYVNPLDYPNRYKGFLLTEGNIIPQSELAVAIRHEEEIIGILNLEHPEPQVFLPQHVEAMDAVSNFISPFLLALRERYDRQRAKELGILYTMNHLLTRMASTYQHLLGQPLA